MRCKPFLLFSLELRRSLVCSYIPQTLNDYIFQTICVIGEKRTDLYGKLAKNYSPKIEF